MVTLEEEHSTRGRARMLWEMLQGEAVRGGWSDEDVKRSLDLCLSCKACKSECPTNVDIATYRAEFLSHYYETHRRPLHAHVFAKIDQWARLASSTSPGIANAAARLPGASGVMRSALGIARQRELPRFASESFVKWAARERVPTLKDDRGGRLQAAQAVLWTDTFNNYFSPETAKSALAVLRHAGVDVVIPGGHVCCGRPLYDFGLLREAKQYLERVLDALAGPIEAGSPIVVLEPSCASVFRDELRGLFPNDPRAERLRSQTYLLSEFLQRRVSDYQPPRLNAQVLLHGHCHHKSIMKMADEEQVLRRAGATLTSLDSGCCGMAGPFGFDADKYDVSMAIGERVLLPAVRRASPEALIVSDGFSCREQIAHATSRRALHLADLLASAL
jgi:Fe-S oxidoreductase